MEARSLKNLKDDVSELKSFTWSTCFQWLVAKLQSLVDIELDHKNRNGFQSIAQKSIHFKSTLMRDQLIRLVMLLSDDCNLAMFMQTLTDLRVMLNTLTP